MTLSAEERDRIRAIADERAASEPPPPPLTPAQRDRINRLMAPGMRAALEALEAERTR